MIYKLVQYFINLVRHYEKMNMIYENYSAPVLYSKSALNFNFIK